MQMSKMSGDLTRKVKVKRLKREVEGLERYVRRMRDAVSGLGVEQGPDDEGIFALVGVGAEQVVLRGVAVVRVVEMGVERDEEVSGRRRVDRWVEEGKGREDARMGKVWEVVGLLAEALGGGRRSSGR